MTYTETIQVIDTATKIYVLPKVYNNNGQSFFLEITKTQAKEFIAFCSKQGVINFSCFYCATNHLVIK